MKLVCPRCRAKVMPADVNVATDLAKCGNCHEILKASALVEEAEALADLAPPAGSRIALEGDPDSGWSILLPPAGFSWTLLFPLVFCLFWLGFITFWTWGASRASGAFALFSIPFWCVGVAMFGGLVNGVCERQRLELSGALLRLRKIRPFFSRTLEIPLEQVAKVAIEDLVLRDPFSMAKHMRRFPLGALGGARQTVITHGTRKTPVGEHLSEAEQEWLARVLGGLISRSSGRRVSSA